MAAVPEPHPAAPPGAQPGRALTPEAILRWAVQSLYQDEALPRGPLLQWFLLYLAGVKLSHKQLRALILDTPGVYVEPMAAKKLNFSALLEEPPPSWQGFVSEEDVLATLGEEVWAEVSRYFGQGGWDKAEDSAHKYYVVAAWLQDASPRFGEMSFGRLLSIVRCGAQSKYLLGHRAGLLVPYAQSEEYERNMNAIMGQPTHVAPDEAYVKTWEELRQGLRALLQEQKEYAMEVSKVKTMFRSVLRTELSETVFGHQCLSKLLGDPQLGEDFLLEAVQGNRYMLRLISSAQPAAIVTAPPARAADAGPSRRVVRLELAAAVDPAARPVSARGGAWM